MARGVALIGMFVAHTAPSAGPGGALMVSEYFPFPLFVLLLGAGAELVARRSGAARHAVESLVRALFLLLVGRLLLEAGAQIWIVLGAMALASAGAWAMARLPSVVLLVGALAGLVTSGRYVEAVSQWSSERFLAGADPLPEVVGLLLVPSYPVPFVLACTALGIVATRWLVPREGSAPGALTLVAATGVLVAIGGGLLALGRLDRLDVSASSWGWPTVVVSLALALAALSASVWLVHVLGRRWTTPLHAMGAMSFTLYSAHVVWLGYWVRVVDPGGRDDTWVNVVGMSVAAVVVGLLWRLLPFGGAWWRGPLEGVVGSVARVAGRLTPGNRGVASAA